VHSSGSAETNWTQIKCRVQECQAEHEPFTVVCTAAGGAHPSGLTKASPNYLARSGAAAAASSDGEVLQRQYDFVRWLSQTLMDSLYPGGLLVVGRVGTLAAGVLPGDFVLKLHGCSCSTGFARLTGQLTCACCLPCLVLTALHRAGCTPAMA
jgi:hypothetical protein